jgi:hypothetical protein
MSRTPSRGESNGDVAALRRDDADEVDLRQRDAQAVGSLVDDDAVAGQERVLHRARRNPVVIGERRARRRDERKRHREREELGLNPLLSFGLHRILLVASIFGPGYHSRTLKLRSSYVHRNSRQST